MKESGESILKWHTDLPHMGWTCVGIDELKKGDFDNCEWCGTRIRFLYILQHPKQELLSMSGVICAGYLTENPKWAEALEKEFNSYKSKLLTEQKKKDREKKKQKEIEEAQIYAARHAGWRKNAKGNKFKFHNGCWLTVFRTIQRIDIVEIDKWKYVYNNTFSKEYFDRFEEAVDHFYDNYT